MAKDEKQERHESAEKQQAKPKAGRWSARKLLLMLFVALVAFVFVAAAYVRAMSPAAVFGPQMDHYHFRMQVVVDGENVDFGSEAFQTPYDQDQCSVEMTPEPIHFHDQKGQFAHIHWKGITGGLVLKNYGWNFVGGNDGLLGYRADELPSIKSVPIHGDVLPDVPEDASFWVYTGDESGYQKREFDDFKNQDLEKFFGKESNFKSASQGGQGGGLTGWLIPKAHAHAGEHHSDEAGGQTEIERLTRLNNLLGNVVIFVQEEEPSAEEVKARFDNLEPLPESTCGG